MGKKPLNEGEPTKVLAIRVSEETFETLDQIRVKLRSENYDVSNSSLGRVLVETGLPDCERAAKESAVRLPDHPDLMRYQWRQKCKVCNQHFYSNITRATCGVECLKLRRKARKKCRDSNQ